MANAKGAGSAVYEGVIEKAKRLKTDQDHARWDADDASDRARRYQESYERAREGFEQCVAWLDEELPMWRDTLTEPEQEMLFGPKTEVDGG